MPWRRNHRPIYSHAELKRVIEPKSIAIVGLSSNETSFGARTLVNLKLCQGVQIYGVNPRGGELHGVRCFPTIAEVPGPVDCAIVATPREAVVALTEQCAKAGVGGCVVYASDFAETGIPERMQQQERLTAIAGAARMPIVGPNCIGIINNIVRAGMLFLGGYDTAPWRPGPIGLISQSGALGYTLAQACERGGNYSHYLTAGNQCDVDVCDYISYLTEDPNCGVITCLLEGLKDGERLMEAGEKALTADKPIVLYKMGTGSAGAEAAMSHTGSLAGADAAYRAAFRRHGIIAVDNLEQVYETAAFLAKAGKPKAPGVAILTSSGGAGVIAADKAEKYNVALPQPGAAAVAVLKATIPEFGAARNPCDVTAQVINSPESFNICGRALLQDAAYGAMVIPQGVSVRELTPARVPVVSGLAQAMAKPICLIWMTEWLEGPGSELYEANPYVAMFRSADRCFAALAAWNWREAVRRAPRGRVRLAPGGKPAAAAKRLLAQAGTKLTEREAKEVLAAYGVPVTGERLVGDREAAVQAAEALGFPVVLKVESPDIAHKTEAGVVRLNLADGTAVRAAYDAVMAAAGKVRPKPEVRGVLVQPMIGAGVELIVGSKLDPQFGPMVVVGMGGILAELLRDTAVELAPVDRGQALAMLQRLSAYKLLTGFRGSAPVALDRLADIIVGVSELAADQAGAIAEIDVNPVICGADRAIAVDALIVRAG
ncbi:MAG TPA: acetate--CoA ligase family protein [Candidatus Sulfotelmatobacter sp.]|nr:acetate--CoA ligase family protein [Candidatus Sulfotelmatobacter sp.]